jgi:hypothetical protein
MAHSLHCSYAGHFQLYEAYLTYSNSQVSSISTFKWSFLSLFDDAVQTVNDELRKRWKELVMA